MRTRMLVIAIGLGVLGPLGSSVTHAQGKQGASAQLTWMGAKADKVQAGKAVRPDGKQDGQFRLLLTTERTRKILHILLRSCDNRGVLTGRVAWDTDRTRLWVLGVFKQGRALRTGPGRTIDTVRGTRNTAGRYDLYAATPRGGFKPGDAYCAYVTFGDGMGVSARSVVTEPVAAGLSYVGRTRDRVGRGKSLARDGVPDAQFVLRMDSSGRKVELRSVTLQALDPRGRDLAGRRWNTSLRRDWALGVERGGRPLVRKDRPLRNTFQGMAEYHLFASPRGPMRPGGKYKVIVTFRSGAPAVATVTLPATQPASASMAYIGLDADKLGARSPSGPDGTPDGHFRLTVKAPGGRTVTGIVLRAIWPSGTAVQGQIWDTVPRGYRMVAVYSRGRMQNPKDRGLKQRIRGQEIYDLYIYNTGWVRPLQTFQAEVVFEGGDRVFAKAKVLQTRIAGPLTVDLTHQGFVADKVGTGGRGGPDGRRDAKFTMTVNTGGRMLQVDRLELSVSDANGNTWRKTWDTRPGGHWILGVESQGKRLNPTDRNLSPTIQGRVTYTLWASNDVYTIGGKTLSYFLKGGYFTVRLFTKSHPMVRKTIRLRR